MADELEQAPPTAEEAEQDPAAADAPEETAVAEATLDEAHAPAASDEPGADVAPAVEEPAPEVAPAVEELSHEVAPAGEEPVEAAAPAEAAETQEPALAESAPADDNQTAPAADVAAEGGAEGAAAGDENAAAVEQQPDEPPADAVAAGDQTPPAPAEAEAPTPAEAEATPAAAGVDAPAAEPAAAAEQAPPAPDAPRTSRPPSGISAEAAAAAAAASAAAMAAAGEGGGSGGAAAGSRPSTAPKGMAAIMPNVDGSYDKGAFMLEPDLEVQLHPDSVQLAHILSLQSYKRNNLFFIDDDTLITSAGNTVLFITLPDMTQSYLPGLDGGGIGAIAVHPSRRLFAVAEKCRYRSPNIYVYQYPDMTLVKVLRNGTEHAYSALAFNERGDMLASVGGYPDYLLTLWRWDDESIILRSKAFSQDVYTVRFSPYFEGFLTTSGTGHIRFWKMASTFTGLKLQGQIGKFGNVELSDVGAFVEMPDGKVLSGTETGELLMWDGGLIKVVLTRKDSKPCHEGAVEVLIHDRASNIILTGGHDGYVRLWDYVKVNEAEAGEDSHDLAITPLDEVLIAPGARIKSLLWERRQWLILDEAGALYRVVLPESGAVSKGCQVIKLQEFHSGGIINVMTSPKAHVVITAGADGSLRVFDYAQRMLSHTTMFASAITCASGMPREVDPALTLLVTGHEDGVARVAERCKDGFKLLAAFKPHKSSVTALAISSDGRHLATCGSDHTAFFFRIDSPTSIVPLAYTALPATVNCAVWSPDGAQLLVGCANGSLYEISAPADDHDNHHSFETDLPRREYLFKLPKPKRKKKTQQAAEGGDGGAGGEGGDAGAKPEDEKAKAAADGQPAEGATDGEGAKEEAKEDEGDEEEDPFQEDATYEVLTVMYPPNALDQDTFYATLGGRAAGQLWSCTFDSQAEPLPVTQCIGTAPTTFLQYHPDGRFLFMGSQDGMLRLAPTGVPFGMPDGLYWEAPLHDMTEGQVMAAALSFDEKYLLSASYDGSLYLQLMYLRDSPGLASPSQPEDLPSLAQAGPGVSDISSKAEYTLEEAKQKAEQDQLIQAAEAKKMGVREYLQKIRSDFEELLAENNSKPEAERLPRAEFEIDPGLREMMEEEAHKREEVARLELQWDMEKRRLALAKVRAFFLDHIEVERIVLHALEGKMFVTSFRTAKLSPEVQAELAAIHAAAANLGGRAAGAAGGEDAGERLQLGQRRDAGGADAGRGAKGGDQGEDTSKLTKADLRRLARKKREAEWQAFNATRPDDKYENPADVAAIEEAERNMGDFKLKSDPNYVVPEEERMTPARKRQQMLLLEEAMYNVKMDFNRKFLALREVKKKVVSEINSKVGRLRDINTQLNLKEQLATKSMRPEEVPEQRDVVTDEELDEFTRRKEEEERKAAQGGGLGGFAGGGAAKKPPPVKPSAGAPAGPGTSRPGAAGTGQGAGGAGAPGVKTPEADSAALSAAAEDAISKMMAAVPQSDVERQLAQYNKRRLEFMRIKLKGEVKEMVEAFDDALGQLRREKYRLEADLKLAEIKMLVHYQELQLLRDFDKREILLIQKRQAKLDDRQEIVDKIGECNNKLEQKKAELESLIARRAAVTAEFDNIVPDSDPFREPLSKIFFRKIKRSKKKGGAGADDDYDSEEEDDDDGGDDEDMDDDDDGGEEVCPPGCDQNLYEKVCDLREKRLDEEDMINEFQKTTEVLRKEKEQLAKKQRLVEQGLAAINSDIMEFQKEKQGRLNQIDVVVNLRMHQIEYLVEGRLPEDLSAGLVFSNKELERLKRRIDELEQEKAELKQRQKELRREHLQLLRDKKEKETKVGELEARAYDVQMLKFGQVINLELLDKIGASKGTEELKAELRRQEALYAQELSEWEKKIAARTDELMALTRENTACLNAVSELTAAQRKLEGSLTATRKTMFSDPVTQRREEVEERDQLVQLVNAQAKEIEKLKAQMNALKRKDTSVYA